jgi:hypothetical protein
VNRNGRRTRGWAWLVLLRLAAVIPVDATEPEDELRSATVLAFIRHSEWRHAADGPIRIAVVGRAGMVQTLRRTLEGKTANNRAIRVVDGLQGDPRSCQILYVAGENNGETRETLAAWRAHALTIGESDRFLENGGAVRLLIVDGHMSFEVSLDALDRAGVAISSTLLRYGQVARPPRPPV